MPSPPESTDGTVSVPRAMLAPGIDSVGRTLKDAFIAGAYNVPLPPSSVTRALRSADTAVGATGILLASIAGAYDAPLPPSSVTKALPAALGVPNTLLSGARKALLPSSGGSAVIFVLPSRTIAEGPSADAPTSNCSVAT